MNNNFDKLPLATQQEIRSYVKENVTTDQPDVYIGLLSNEELFEFWHYWREKSKWISPAAILDFLRELEMLK